jgi:transcriptional regulator with XRE-family HTH domain
MTARQPVAFIGARIRAARVAANLTQAQLAKAAEISRPQVANIEGGVSDPSLGAFVAIVRALKLDATTLIRDPACMNCGDDPPRGFACNVCGAGATP